MCCQWPSANKGKETSGKLDSCNSARCEADGIAKDIYWGIFAVSANFEAKKFSFESYISLEKLFKVNHGDSDVKTCRPQLEEK